VTNHISVRDTRDRLSEFLNLGQPYPLQDLTLQIPDQKLIVPHNTVARIYIEQSQRGVDYELRFKGNTAMRTEDFEEEGGDIPIREAGNGSRLELTTYRITKDITFQIFAQKTVSQKQAYLHQTVEIVVGLDINLRAWIREAPPIEPEVTSMIGTDARIADYHSEIEVEIETSQEGVDYQLIEFRQLIEENIADTDGDVQLSPDTVRGNLSNIILRTHAIDEDIDIGIRAIKVFEDSDDDPKIALMTVRLPLKVRANIALGVTAEPQVIPYETDSKVILSPTQASAHYQVFARPILDKDFKQPTEGKPEKDPTFAVSAPAQLPEGVVINKPAVESTWQQQANYQVFSSVVQGNGGEITIQIPTLTDDTLIIVKASKEHEITKPGAQPEIIESAVQLAEATAVLVEPNPLSNLHIRALRDESGEMVNTLQVSRGQRGIFYYFHVGDAATEPPNVYIHKRDHEIQRFNKGVGQMKVQIDFVIVENTTLTGNASTNIPEPPILENLSIPFDTEIPITAKKAQTGASVTLKRTLMIASPPAIGLRDAVINYGDAATIVIRGSRPNEIYHLILNGEAIGSLQGQGEDDLLFRTDSLVEDTAYHILIEDRSQIPITIEQMMRLLVRVRPDSTIIIEPLEVEILPETTVTFRIANSQSGINYQLLNNDEPFSEAVEGNNGFILLESLLLTEDTVLTVQASQIDNQEIAVVFPDEIHVTIVHEPVEPQGPDEDGDLG